MQNTGYFVADKLFYPGDSFINPERVVDVLALPVAGPWCKIGDAIRYALLVRPRVAFPVHDGMIKPGNVAGLHSLVQNVLRQQNLEFMPITDGETKEL